MASYGDRVKSTSINGVKLYHVSSAPNVATWLNPKKQRALRKNPRKRIDLNRYMQRVEIIQDLKFEDATTRIKATPDGEYLIASGTYHHRLDDDYSKLAFLCADRSIYLQAKYGKHHSLRIPSDMTYDNRSCDLLCAASSPDLYRISLEQGRFISLLSTQSPALNVVSRSNVHGLIACGGEDGAVECFDMRMKSSAARINAVTHGGDAAAAEVTAIEFDDSEGLQVAVGSSAGKVFIYDLRTSAPIQVKDHIYESPILSIKWQRTINTQETKLITTDKHIVRIWDPNTEEMEETGQTTIYDDYKFVTKEDLEKLQLTATIYNEEYEEEDEEAAKKVSKKKKKPGLSGEDFSGGRFDNMFHNPEFQIDPESYEYRVLHPVASSSTKQPSLLDEHFEPVTAILMHHMVQTMGDQARNRKLQS
ncbi:hypothetical protein Bca101_045472 [Brassica carinata]